MKISRASIHRYAHGDSIDTDPLKLVQSGWAKGEITITLVPLMLPKNVPSAPECFCECRASCVSLKGTATLMISMFYMNELSEQWILIPVSS